MGKSLEFCKMRANDPDSGLPDIDWNKALEVDSEPILDLALNGERNIYLKAKDDKVGLSYKVKITFDKDGDFQYVTTKQISHDGTLLFEIEALHECVYWGLQTYYIPMGPPPNHCTLHYTVGDFVIVNEYGDQFATTEKPWMKQRTTVYLPLKVEYEEDKNV